MKAGKVPEAVLKRSVLEIVNEQGKKHGWGKAGVGVDAALFTLPGDVDAALASSAALCGNEAGLAGLTVQRALHSLAAAGGVPCAVTVQFVFPTGAAEAEIRRCTSEAVEVCTRAGVVLAGGHTQISGGTREILIAATAVGRACAPHVGEDTAVGGFRVDAGERQADAWAGCGIGMTGYAGRCGAALLAREYRDRLRTRYPSDFLAKAEAVGVQSEVLRAVQVLRETSQRAPGAGLLLHDVAEGGVFGAVWELAERLGMGAELFLRQIPIRQETVEVCEFFEINPYQLRGDGALLFVTRDINEAVDALAQAGIAAAVIGRVLPGNDRIVRHGDEVRYLEPNRVEEYETAKARAERKDGYGTDGIERTHFEGDR